MNPMFRKKKEKGSGRRHRGSQIKEGSSFTEGRRKGRARERKGRRSKEDCDSGGRAVFREGEGGRARYHETTA